MTYTDMYKEADLEQLNFMLAAQGKNYEFYEEEGEIKCRINAESLRQSTELCETLAQ